MKLETFKTMLLIGLIGLSLIFTFSLWNYKIGYSGPHNTDPAYIPETDAGGEVQTKSDVIIPSKAIFHIDDQYYGYDQPTQLVHLYKDIQHWSLTEYVAKEEEEFRINESYIEIEYPEKFPVAVIKQLFTLADEIELPNWNFDRILVTLEEEQHSVSLYFISVDKRNYIRFTVYDKSAYTTVEKNLVDRENLTEYMVYDEANQPLYLPVEPTTLSEQTLALATIKPRVFVDALFINPSLVVTPNFGESYFIDGQRDMRVVNNGLRLEFTNPLQDVTDRMNALQIIEKSIADINDHKGWTSDFYIAGIDRTINRIVYQMYYENYPVYDDQAGTTIEHQWRNQQLYKYNRPLFSLSNPLGGDTTELASGNDVIYFLENVEKYHIEKVSDVKIGYYASNIDEKLNIITLEPSWFMLYNGKWQRIRFDELHTYDEGGI